MKYTERETRLVVAWCMIMSAVNWFVFWAIKVTGSERPAYIVDLAFPMILAVAGAYILKRRLPDAPTAEVIAATK